MKAMENYLDCYLFAVSENCKVISKESDPYLYACIKTARDYRTKHPWQNTNTVIAAGAETTLAMIK